MNPFIPSWLDDAGLSQAEFRLYCHLCRRADNKTGIAWPSYESIQAACGFGHATVWRTAKSLEAKGFITKAGKPFGGSCRYRILSPNSDTGDTIEHPSIVSPEESLESANSFTTGTIEESPIVSPRNSNRSPNETSIVSPEEREGYPLKGIHKRKSTRENSFEEIQFAQWFKSSLPTDEQERMDKNWLSIFCDAYDKLVRLDKRSPEQIREVCQWARADSFWQNNFKSPSKLRTRNGDGTLFFDVFTGRMKTPAKPTQTKPKEFTANDCSI